MAILNRPLLLLVATIAITTPHSPAGAGLFDYNNRWECMVKEMQGVQNDIGARAVAEGCHERFDARSEAKYKRSPTHPAIQALWQQVIDEEFEQILVGHEPAVQTLMDEVRQAKSEIALEQPSLAEERPGFSGFFGPNTAAECRSRYTKGMGSNRGGSVVYTSCGKAFRGIEAALDVGGSKVMFSPPVGWCLYPKSEFQIVKAEYERLTPENSVLAAFGDCNQVEENQLSGKRIMDFGMLVSPQEFLERNMGTNRPGFIDSMADTMKGHDPHPATTTAADRLNNSALNFRTGEVRMLGLLDKDKNALYTGFVARVRIGTDDVNQIAVSAMTVVRRRILNYNLYADHKAEVRLPALLARSRSELARLVANND